MAIRKKYKLSILALILIGLVFLCVSRWNAWFGQPEEEPYGVSDVPWREMLTFGNKGEFSRRLSWQCDSIVYPAHLELLQIDDTLGVTAMHIIKANGETFSSRAGKASYYHVEMDSLRPDTKYRYRIVTNDAPSKWHDFTTQPLDQGRNMSFIYVGDIQDTINGATNRMLIDAKLRHPNTELLICGGDFVERPRDNDWQVAFNSLDSLRTSMPIMCVTGNHDYLKGIVSKLERRFSLIFSYFLDSKIGDNQVYDLRYGDVHFFLLDSFRELPYLYTQRKWLQDKINTSDAKWKIVVSHHPIYSIRGKNNLTQRYMFADIIEQNGIDLVLQAHEHNYARKNIDNDNQTVYIISHCSPKTYSYKNQKEFDAFSHDDRYYQYLRVHGDSMFVSSHSAYDGSLVDSIIIVKRDHDKSITQIYPY